MSRLHASQLIDENNEVINVQNPLPTDGDSVYTKDIVLSQSSLSDGWTGSVLDLFNDRFSTITNTTSNNPKTITIRFQRPVQTNILGFATNTGDFSNTKVIGLLEPLTTFTVIDESADSTTKVALIPPVAPTTINGLTIEFHTANAVSLSTVTVSKALQRISRLQAVQPNGTVIDISATDSGNMKVTDAENGLAIAKGEVEGSDFVHKFGAAPDFDFGDGQVDVWDGANDAGINAMQYTYSTTADIDSISSSNSADTSTVIVQGLDANWELVVQTVTLTGQATATLSTPLLRVFRALNTGSVDLAGDVYVYINGATVVAGVPSNANEVRAVIGAGNNQTLMAIYTIPNGKTGYMRDWFASTAGANKASNYAIRVKARPPGQVFQLKHLSAISDNATSYIKHTYSEPEVFIQRTDIIMSAEMQANGTGASVSAGFDIVLVDN